MVQGNAFIENGFPAYPEKVLSHAPPTLMDGVLFAMPPRLSDIKIAICAQNTLTRVNPGDIIHLKYYQNNGDQK